MDYNYTKDGNVAYINDTSGTAGVEQYWYDTLGRLTKASATSTFGTIMYGYSSVGNRIWKNEGGTNLTYNYGTYSQLTSNGSCSYAYDAHGNVISRTLTNTVRYNYIYNSFGQMTEVRKQNYSGGWGANATIARYYYDANGARAMTNEGGTVFLYVYSGHDPIYYNGTDGKGQKDIYIGGKLEVRLVSYDKKWSYMADALGSTRKVLWNGQGTSGKINFTAVTYKPFGAAVGISGSDKFTYTGEMVDSPTGLVYLSARYYDPQLGRFYALDPELGKVPRPQTLNRYVYCVNNPLRYKDSTGNDPEFALIAAGMFIGSCWGLIDWGMHDWNHLDRLPAYVGAGLITGATITTMLLADPASAALAKSGGIVIANTEYAALKTLFLGGSPDQAAWNGLKSGLIGLVFQIMIPGIQFVPDSGAIEEQIINYFFQSNIVNGLNAISRGIGEWINKNWPNSIPHVTGPSLMSGSKNLWFPQHAPRSGQMPSTDTVTSSSTPTSEYADTTPIIAASIGLWVGNAFHTK